MNLTRRIAIAAAVAAFALTTAAPARAQAPTPPQAPAMTFSPGVKAGLMNFAVKEDAVADFEAVLTKIREALAKSDREDRRKQADGWRVYKLPAANGVVVFMCVIDPVVNGADYHPVKILIEGFGAEAQPLVNKMKGVQSIDLADIQKAIDMTRTGEPVAIVPPPPVTPGTILRAGPDIKEPRVVSKVQPDYPVEAVKNKIQGSVYLDVVLATDGTVKDAKAIGGPKELADAAITAVKQWKYSPTLLNGQPIQVSLYVTVVFQLAK